MSWVREKNGVKIVSLSAPTPAINNDRSLNTRPHSDRDCIPPPAKLKLHIGLIFFSARESQTNFTYSSVNFYPN